MTPVANSRLHGEGRFLPILTVILLASVLSGAAVVAAPPVSPEVAPTQLTPLADAFIAEGLPDRNFGADGKLWVGYDAGGGYRQEQTLLAFPNAGVTAPVSRAVLKLWLAGAVTAGAELQVMVYPVTGTWDQATVTWNQRPAFEAKPVSFTHVRTELGWYEWDVTSAWQQNGQTSPFSLLLSGPSNVEQNERAFWSNECTSTDCPTREPVLEIELATPTPTATRTPAPTPTATPKTCWAAWQNASIVWVPLQGSQDVGFDYGACDPHASIDMNAQLSGGAVFDQKTAVKTKSVSLTGNGSGSLKVYPAAGAKPGDKFSLAAELAGTPLPTREGVVGGPLYLPLIVRNSQLLVSTPTATPTLSATATPTPTSIVVPTETPSPKPSATASRTPTSTFTPTATNTPSATPTSTHTHTPTNTPTATPTPTKTPELNETVRGTVWKMPANVGLYGVVFELHQSNGKNCGALVPLTPPAVTDASGRYSITTTWKVTYSICIRPIVPLGCSEIAAGQPYDRIVTYTQEGQVITGPASLVDFQYNCP